ncbi:VanZ family protein [Microbacterium sp. RD1]|uniref:VanZ family protein n=1 Tax=Microbacterium sp. RD1 TaxID=3457313 RepID=UPI003FA6013F
MTDRSADAATEVAVRRRVTRARVALAAYLLLLGASVLLPIGPMAVVRAVAGQLREAGAWFVRDGWVEVAANIVMFVVLSFLLVLSMRRRPALGLLIACTLSVLIEAAQMLLPARVPSLRDILANVAGALLGYLLARFLLARGRK